MKWNGSCSISLYEKGTLCYDSFSQLKSGQVWSSHHVLPTGKRELICKCRFDCYCIITTSLCYAATPERPPKPGYNIAVIVASTNGLASAESMYTSRPIMDLKKKCQKIKEEVKDNAIIRPSPTNKERERSVRSSLCKCKRC
jgi:hypothetical protein